uniref:Uncharacterized protein n=1 Tax=Arundo donax TaxID=35708 RepID=A0A0A9CBR9_ARUDO
MPMSMETQESRLSVWRR